MRLSTVLELLVIALLVAFAASRVIDPPSAKPEPGRLLGSRATRLRQRQAPGSVAPANPPSRYCTCSSLTCNCCREFSLPVVPVKGPGCATVSYLHDDAMMITMSFGDRVLRNITVNSKKPKPICMGMPGGISKFCGRLYSIKKEGDNFKACLGLELRALDDVEAALRVSCFKFGPNGVNVEPGEAVPVEKIKEDEDEDDDDDFGLGALDDDDDDDDDDYDALTGGEDDDDDRPPAKDNQYADAEADSSDSSDADADYTGLSSLSEELFGGIFGSEKKQKRKPAASYDDSSEEDDYEPEPPPKSQVQSQPPTPQVNLVVMQPVILPTPEATTKRAKVKKRPTKPPARVTPAATQPTPAKRVRPTSAPVKKVRTTTAPPLKTLATSTAIPSEAPSTTTKKPKKKKKKPSRRRRPTTPKPVANATEAAATAIVQTSTSVSVLQGDHVLNGSAEKIDPGLKIPMSSPVLESKPVDQAAPDVVTDKVLTEAQEATTQTIMQNTIPTDEAFDDGLHPISIQKVVVKLPAGEQGDGIAGENLIPVGTSLNPGAVEYTTVQDTTRPEMVESTDGYQNILRDSEKVSTSTDAETTENYYEYKGEATDNTVSEDHENSGGFDTTLANKDISTEASSSATEAYYSMDEATDRTEAITENVHDKENRASDEGGKEDEDDDDVLGGLDISAGLGLDDDDDDDEKSDEKNPAANDRPEEKDDEDDDILDGLDGGILDDDEDDEDDSKSKGETEERSIKHDRPEYKINPMLYRLARVSSGFTATARHLPRSDTGRNRRNNKRMRFPPLEITT